jgi:D-alanyl-D-alanine carboxypeptidase/D-alanyl-D-alanine-endopeptidase (penicillin-binding protein 4)
VIDRYLDNLALWGIDTNSQAVWVQSSQGTLAQYQGKTRLPAASLTKLATTLLALDHWPTDHRFVTKIFATGSLQEGVLTGDLVVQGGGNPFYVWESAIALGNRLNELGIRQVTGRLVIDGVFVMNFERDRALAGELFRQGLDSRLWGYEADVQYQTLPPGTPEPQVEILGGVALESVASLDNPTLLVQQKSLPMVALLKQMNIYSNNIMAELLVDVLGGARVLEQGMVKLAKVAPAEVQFINGSGLGPENQISARGACQVLTAISNRLEADGLGLPDVMPIANKDPGTLEIRTLPQGIMAKTGTLWNVSTLAGVIPAGEKPVQSLKQPHTLCFAIMNQGSNIDLFYDEQDILVDQLKTTLQITLP